MKFKNYATGKEFKTFCDKCGAGSGECPIAGVMHRTGEPCRNIIESAEQIGYLPVLDEAGEEVAFPHNPDMAGSGGV